MTDATPLQQMTANTPTCLWNDSASIQELTYSIAQGAVGATCNPVIVIHVLNKEMDSWRERIYELIEEMPEDHEDDIGWRLVEEISQKGAGLLMPIFEDQQGKNGRLSIQTDPRFYRNTDRMVEQAVHFSNLAPNMIVKIPATRAGIPAMEEATYRGVSINATVSFTVPQCIAVAEAVERGLKRREAEGKSIDTMGPVCTIMVGRVDDWLRVTAEKEGIITDPGYLEWAGVAVFKNAYSIFKERGYRLRLLSAAFRNHMHWSEFIGGDVVISPPYKWQVLYNNSDVDVVSRIDKPVDSDIVTELKKKFVDFSRAYEADGMSADEFDTYGATVRTLRQFIDGGQQLSAIIRDFMLPNPDV